MTSETGTLRLLFWAFRHPLKSIGILLAAGIGMALTAEVDRSMAILMVRSGQTAKAHRYAEGIQ